MIKKSAINRIIFSIPGQTSIPMNTKEAINLRIIARTMMLKKFSAKDFSKNPLSKLIKKDTINMKK